MTQTTTTQTDERTQRFIVKDSSAGSCVLDTLTGRFSAHYQGTSDSEEIARQMNLNPDPAVLAAWSAPKTHSIVQRCDVQITFKDGETITEHAVDEIHLSEDSLFLRRYGRPGTEFDRYDIESWHHTLD